jgi:uncharacterized protein (DUF58 family)
MFGTKARAHATGARFIDPKILARIDNLELVARTVVDGFISGLHRSPYLGLSIDFAEHRAYVPGDDIRRIDWRVFGRTDRFYVKEFEADTNANFSVVLDISRSMEFGTGGITKLEYAKFLTASLTYMSNRQRDRVGLITFDTDIVDIVPPSAKHMEVVLHTLERTKATREGALGTLTKIAETFKRRSVIVLISDLYEEPTAVMSAVNSLRRKGNDLVVFHVLDPAEVEFSYDRPLNFEDLETGQQVAVVPETLRDQYRTLLTEHRESIARLMGNNRVDYAFFDTSIPLDLALLKYLMSRQRTSRVR